MDTKSMMDPAVISGLFENGLMGVEVPEEFGGSGLNFMSACIVVEEIAKVDPAVAVLVDIQNTLINNMLRCAKGASAAALVLCPSVCLSVRLFVCLSCVSVCALLFSHFLPLCPHPSICLSVYLSTEGSKIAD